MFFLYSLEWFVLYNQVFNNSIVYLLLLGWVKGASFGSKSGNPGLGKLLALLIFLFRLLLLFFQFLPFPLRFLL